MKMLRGVPVLITALLAWAVASAQQPPLAEVARKEAERRKGAAAPTRVYTNADLKGRAPLTTSAATPEKPAGTPAATQAETRTEEVRDEAWWRKRMTELRDQLSKNRRLAEALQSRINALWADFTARDDPAQRAEIEANRNQAMADLDRVNAEVALLEKAVADLEEEARRADVPPGWLR